MITIVTIAVAICAILAAMGFKGRSTTIGVDLGTTFSVIGIVHKGKVTIVSDLQGRNIFPSIISYDDNEIIHGLYDALPYLSTKPLNTIFNAKRFIGKSMHDQDISEYAASHPFKVVEGNNSEYGDIAFEVQGHTSESTSLVTPIQVGTQVLKHLLAITAKFIGHNQVNKAVIAVPAKFSSVQRQATAAAFKAVGLKVVRVLEEPTAAAIAYELHKNSLIRHILVYDFGGGTLDVSLLFVSKGSVQVYATDGDDLLGGSDLDLCMYDIIKHRITEEEMKHINGNSKEIMGDLESCHGYGIRKVAENIKKELTYNDSVSFACVNPSLGSIITFNVTKSDFEIGCKGLFDRALLPVTRLLDELGMSKDDIDEIVLVGGTTRIPLVKKQLRDFFGKALNDHIDPDITVAFGAASVLD